MSEPTAERDVPGTELPDGPGGYDEYEPAAPEKDVPDFAWAEMLTHQECAAKKHPDWFIDSEHNLLCPWCEIDRLKADHRVVYEKGAEAVCSCGAHLSIYGLTRSIASVFAEHVRSTRFTSPAEPVGACDRGPCLLWADHDGPCEPRVTSPAECDRGPCYLGYDHDGPCKPGRVLPPAGGREQEAGR